MIRHTKSKPAKWFVASSVASMMLSLMAPQTVAAQTRTKKESSVNDMATSVASPRLTTGSIDTNRARSIEMGVGRSIIVDLPRDAKEVFVGNPAVANAVVRSARKLFVIGVATGATTIIALDENGQQIAALEMQIGREPGLLQKTMKVALPHTDIKAVSIGDSIVLTGIVDNVLEAQKAVDIAKGFVGISARDIEGKVINSLTIRGKDQVMLKVTVAEVKRTAIKQLGVNLAGEWKSASGSITAATSNLLPLGGGSIGALANAAALSSTPKPPTIDVKMLERHGLMRTLAEPNLTAISGETAKFVAGGEIPVLKNYEPATQSISALGGVVNTPPRYGYEYKSFGVMLNFTPVVLSEGRISLSIATEVTEIDAENGARIDSTIIPAFRSRKAFTTIELPSGGSLMTAGLIQQNTRQALQGVPGLINLPILGALFRSRDYYREETELMIVVTPYIAKHSQPNMLSQPTEGLVEASDPSAVLMGRLNKVYGAAGSPVQANGYRGKSGFIHE